MILLLAACVPIGAGPPPTPLPRGQNAELGVGLLGGVTANPYEQAPHEQAWAVGTTLYLRAELEEGWGILGRADLGLPYGASGGLGVRYGFVRTDGAYQGVQLDLGFFYAGLSIPAAFRVHPKAWVWTKPGVIAGSLIQATLPIGFTYDLSRSLALTGDLQVVVPIAGTDPFDRFNRRQATGGTASLSLATRF